MTDAITDSDLPAWWGSAGWPGFRPGAQFGAGFAWTLAGHSLGGFAERDPLSAPQDLPWPSVPEAKRPLVWRDSVEVRQESRGGWLGPDAALASADVLHQPTRGARARSVFRVENGDFGVNRYGLMFERGDSSHWARVETSAGNRDASAALGRAGDHEWGVAGQLRRGAHTLFASFAQRGAALELANALVGEDASAQSGSARWSWERHGRAVSLTLARGLDRRTDAFDLGGFSFSYSRRDAQENRAELEGRLPWGGGIIQSRTLWSSARVVRTYDDSFDRRNASLWSAIGFERRLGAGLLRLEAGGGRASDPGDWRVAPAGSYAFAALGARSRVFGGAMVRPVWSDLAPAQPAFLQRTTVGGLELAAGSRRFGANAAVVGGTTRDRAIVFPYPITDIWLRAGASAEPRRFDFALLTAAASAGAGPFSAGASGFALGRNQDASEPRVEPGTGVRGWIEGRRAFFQRDLGVRLRLETAGVGERVSKTGGTEETLPGFWTWTASGVLTLADVTMTLRMLNLENKQRGEPWLDPGTGALALGPGRQFAFSLSWRLLN